MRENSSRMRSVEDAEIVLTNGLSERGDPLRVLCPDSIIYERRMLVETATLSVES